MRPRSSARSAPSRRPGEISLDRALSKLGLASRAEARRLIIDGCVTVNGRVVRHPTAGVFAERARIVIDDRAAPSVAARDHAQLRVLLFHKPRGTVTTRRDPEGRRTVFDVLGEAGRGLIAVGRLDLASTGLLIFTNDTQLANRLTDPAMRMPRTYVVTVRGRVTPEAARQIEGGMTVPTGTRGGRPERLSASRVNIRKASNRETHLIVELVEGRNRELRRLFEAGPRADADSSHQFWRVRTGGFAAGKVEGGSCR